MRKRVLRVVVLVLTISVSVTTGHREALRINPNDAAAHNNLGLAFNDLGTHPAEVQSGS